MNFTPRPSWEENEEDKESQCSFSSVTSYGRGDSPLDWNTNEESWKLSPNSTGIARESELRQPYYFTEELSSSRSSSGRTMDSSSAQQQNKRTTPSSIPWDMEVMKVPYFYDFIVEKGTEPYLRLHKHYQHSSNTLLPQIVFLDNEDRYDFALLNRDD